MDKQVFFRKPLNYGAVVTLISPVVLWLIFVVLPADPAAPSRKGENA